MLLPLEFRLHHMSRDCVIRRDGSDWVLGERVG